MEAKIDITVDVSCNYCGHEWKCYQSVSESMTCPNCGDKPDVKKPESKPVYTQAMCDAGELPSVGVECHIDGTGVIYIIVLTKDSEGDLILTPKEGDKYWQRSNVKYIKPVDTRTDEEKALDGLMDSYWDDSNERPNEHSPICFDVLKAIKAGKIHGVTWSKS